MTTADKPHRYFSALHYELADVLKHNPELSKISFKDESNRIKDFLHDYNYGVSPWPMIINDDHVRVCNDIIRTIPVIFDKVIRSLMATDQAWLCDYINESFVTTNHYLQRELCYQDILCRYDASISQEQFKLLELNIGSSLGGWQNDYVYLEIQQLLQDVPNVNQWHIKHRPITENLFKGIYQSILRIKGRAAQGRVLMYLPYQEEKVEGLRHFLRDIAQQQTPSHFTQSTLTFFTEMRSLTFNAAGDVMYQGEVYDALLLPSVDGEDFNIKQHAIIQSHAFKQRFYFPDCDSYTLQSNKLLFALVHEPKVRALLNATELQAIDDYIPWSQKAAVSQLEYQGKHYATADFIREFQSQLVFKKAHSMQGKDVVMGANASSEDWLATYDSICHDNDWLIQQCCEPDEFMTAEPEIGYGTYKMIWGFFSFNGKYAGNIGRGIRTEYDSLVLNSALGALLYVVLEEQAHKNKMTL